MVKVGEEWFTLVSLDGIETEEIVAFSQRTYKNKWQKRFGENLVEVLAGMGHQTTRTVRLVVSPLDTSSQRTLERVAMTEANRLAIKARAVDRNERLPDNLSLTNLKDPYRDYDSNKAAAFLNGYELPRQPGESHEYSNFGTSVLGYLVAEQAGKPYQRLLRERIAKPLRMSDCTVSLNSKQRKRLALPHDKFDSPTGLWTFAGLPGAGGVHATMRDMMRFAKAQLTPPAGKLGEAIELAWKQHRDADASGPAMGLGWMIAVDGQTRWHTGRTGGSKSALFITRKLNRAVIVLCNTSVPNEVDQLAMQLVWNAAGQEVKSEPGEAPEDPSDDLAIDAKPRRRLVGRYQLVPNFIFDVRDGRLMVGITNQPTQEVFPDSPTCWSYRGVDATLEFKLTKTGPAKRLVLHQNGIKQTAPRI